MSAVDRSSLSSLPINNSLNASAKEAVAKVVNADVTSATAKEVLAALASSCKRKDILAFGTVSVLLLGASATVAHRLVTNLNDNSHKANADRKQNHDGPLKILALAVASLFYCVVRVAFLNKELIKSRPLLFLAPVAVAGTLLWQGKNYLSKLSDRCLNSPPSLEEDSDDEGGSPTQAGSSSASANSDSVRGATSTAPTPKPQRSFDLFRDIPVADFWKALHPDPAILVAGKNEGGATLAHKEKSQQQKEADNAAAWAKKINAEKPTSESKAGKFQQYIFNEMFKWIKNNHQRSAKNPEFMRICCYERILDLFFLTPTELNNWRTPITSKLVDNVLSECFERDQEDKITNVDIDEVSRKIGASEHELQGMSNAAYYRVKLFGDLLLGVVKPFEQQIIDAALKSET